MYKEVRELPRTFKAKPVWGRISNPLCVSEFKNSHLDLAIDLLKHNVQWPVLKQFHKWLCCPPEN